MRTFYILRVGGASREDVARVLGIASTSDMGYWECELKEGASDPPIPFVERFTALLAGKFEALEKVGVSRDDINVRVLYEYDEQCNLEFPPQDLRLLGQAGIGLCVSCWQGVSTEQG